MAGRDPSAADVPRLVARLGGASGEAAAESAVALYYRMTDEDGADVLAAAVAAGAPRALARVLARDDMPSDGIEAALNAVTELCDAEGAVDEWAAAGGARLACALLRSPSALVNGSAVVALLAAVDVSDAVRLELAGDEAALAAVAALMARPPPGPDPGGQRPFYAAELLVSLATEALPVGRGAPPRRNPVPAAVARAGGVPLAVGVLRDVLGGRSYPDSALPRAEALRLVDGLFAFCGGDEAALLAARDAGAAPLVARALAEAEKDPGSAPGLAAGVHFLHHLATVSPAGEMAPLASRPGLYAALAAALGLAARDGAGEAAAGGCPPGAVESLIKPALALLLILFDHAPPGHVGASAFARAGGASHLVRPLAALPRFAPCLPRRGGCKREGAPACATSAQHPRGPQAAAMPCLW
jgi:hypothetical protein